MVQSKLMSLICLSTAESEWQSAHLIARELELQRYLLNFMGWNISHATLLTDSQSCIDMSSSLVGAKKKSRHFRLRIHDIRRMIADGTLEYGYIKGTSNPVDAYTKLMSGKDYIRYRDIVMGHVQQDFDVYKHVSDVPTMKEQKLQMEKFEFVGWVEFLNQDANLNNSDGITLVGSVHLSRNVDLLKTSSKFNIFEGDMFDVIPVSSLVMVEDKSTLSDHADVDLNERFHGIYAVAA